MPAYRLFPLSPRAEPAAPVELAAFSDEAAMRWALRQDFPDGCDIWCKDRFVGRVHRALAAGADGEPPAEP